jgi:ribosomal protein L11 methyltransferase
MDYYGVHFQYISTIESTIINDILSSELGEVGFESFEEKENGLSAYIPGNLYNPELFRPTINEFPHRRSTVYPRSGANQR